MLGCVCYYHSGGVVTIHSSTRPLSWFMDVLCKSRLFSAATTRHLIHTLWSAQELGVSILQDLHRQRQTISHARDTLHGADDNISKARRVLTSMSRRITTNKLIMIGIILLLLVSIFLVVYYKYIKK